MMAGRRWAMLAGLLPGLAGCRDAPQARAAEVRSVEGARAELFVRRLALANTRKDAPVAMWLMPPELNEISGLTLTSRGTVLTHDDNVGRVYEIDPKTGILLKSFSLLGNPKGDFEAIAVAGNDVYLMTSNGNLFRFAEGADGKQVPYSTYETGLGAQCEFEGLAFEPDSSRLVMVCKRLLDKHAGHALVIYRLPLPLGDRASISEIAIPIQEVAGSNHWKNFRASDISVDPWTGNYVIIASREKGLVVVTPDGDVVRSEALPGQHPQAEGVAISRDSILMVSDEANMQPGMITLYRWRP